MPSSADAWAARLGSLHRRKQEAMRRPGLALKVEIYSTLDAHQITHSYSESEQNT